MPKLDLFDFLIIAGWILFVTGHGLVAVENAFIYGGASLMVLGVIVMINEVVKYGLTIGLAEGEDEDGQT